MTPSNLQLDIVRAVLNMIVDRNPNVGLLSDIFMLNDKIEGPKIYETYSKQIIEILQGDNKEDGIN